MDDDDLVDRMLNGVSSAPPANYKSFSQWSEEAEVIMKGMMQSHVQLTRLLRRFKELVDPQLTQLRSDEKYRYGRLLMMLDLLERWGVEYRRTFATATSEDKNNAVQSAIDKIKGKF